MCAASRPADAGPPAAPEQGPSRLVTTASGRRLFCQELPGQAPTVVFESGMGATRSMWGLVQPRLEGDLRTLVYDRAGLGRSPAVTGSRRLARLAEDLNELLDQQGPGPFVLVAHSWGAPVVRIAAAARPERVQGIVLIDPTDENCDIYYSRSVSVMNLVQRLLSPALARSGLLGVLFARGVKALPAGAQQDLRREMYTPAAVRAQIAEADQMVQDLRLMQREHHDRPDFPTTVISAGKPDIGKKNRRSLIAAHRRRAAAFAGGRHVLAEDATHLVMLTEPDLLVTEIQRLARAS